MGGATATVSKPTRSTVRCMDRGALQVIQDRQRAAMCDRADRARGLASPSQPAGKSCWTAAAAGKRSALLARLILGGGAAPDQAGPSVTSTVVTMQTVATSTLKPPNK